MIRITGTYRWIEGAHFDHHYFNSSHARITVEALSELGLIRLETDRVLATSAPEVGDIIAATHAYFANVDVAQTALAKAGAILMADVPNYTNLKPDIRLSETTVHDSALI